jgi:hypothetical protein
LLSRTPKTSRAANAAAAAPTEPPRLNPPTEIRGGHVGNSGSAVEPTDAADGESTKRPLSTSVVPAALTSSDKDLEHMRQLLDTHEAEVVRLSNEIFDRGGSGVDEAIERIGVDEDGHDERGAVAAATNDAATARLHATLREAGDAPDPPVERSASGAGVWGWGRAGLPTRRAPTEYAAGDAAAAGRGSAAGRWEGRWSSADGVRLTNWFRIPDCAAVWRWVQPEEPLAPPPPPRRAAPGGSKSAADLLCVSGSLSRRCL